VGYDGRVDFTLSAIEVRVLGSLVEKETATPEYYPLTLNALVNACNQKSNREPVVSYDEAAAEAAVESLRQKRLAAVITGAGMRVPKYRELFSETLNLGRRELAVLCVLMLRGPQTVGELRDRTARLHPFVDLEEVESTLAHLMEREGGALVARLLRRPGTKEPRYAHLLSGEPVADIPLSAAPSESVGEDALAELKEEVRQLRDEVGRLRQQLETFRAQFE
jgi:uncharacterized protein YceH (UPF0502 family)